MKHGVMPPTRWPCSFTSPEKSPTRSWRWSTQERFASSICSILVKDSMTGRSTPWSSVRRRRTWGELQSIEAELAELLAEEDVVNLAAAMDPGSTGRSHHLREPVGGALRVGRTPSRRSAHRQRPDPDASHHRRHGGGRGSSRQQEADMPLRAARAGRRGRSRCPSREGSSGDQGRDSGAGPGREGRGRRRSGHASPAPTHLTIASSTTTETVATRRPSPPVNGGRDSDSGVRARPHGGSPVRHLEAVRA